VEEVTVEWTNGAGLDTSGRDHRFLRVASNDHGQIGWVGSCEGCLFEDTEAIGNNWKGHDPAWEAGGGKWTDTRHSIWRRHRALDNDGPGIWLDGDNTSNTIEGCVARRNALAGIMLELATTRTLVQHNLVEGTRWSAYSGAGILSQAASDNALVHNTVVANEGTGIWLRLDPERRAADGHTHVYNNLVLGNATTATEEAREIAIEGRDAEHARTHRLDGNDYGRRAQNDLRTSTFFFHPDGPAGFRSGALRGWQRRTGSDAHARVIDVPPGGWRAASEASEGVSFPPGLASYGAPEAGLRGFAHRGADLTFVRPEAVGARQ
jgi:parallel beta-helix repeat protein